MQCNNTHKYWTKLILTFLQLTSYVFAARIDLCGKFPLGLGLAYNKKACGAIFMKAPQKFQKFHQFTLHHNPNPNRKFQLKVMFVDNNKH